MIIQLEEGVIINIKNPKINFNFSIENLIFQLIFYNILLISK